MAAIAGFLSGTVRESLAKLVQPMGLVPATAFVLLNFAFVYPVARSDGVGVATQFSGLSGAWQLLVVTVVVLGFGYLLVNLAPTILETLAGHTWRRSPLWACLIGLQRGRRDRLEKKARGGEVDKRTAIEVELATTFALEDERMADVSVAPTRLGNALFAGQSVIYRRYGIDIGALWSQLEAAKDVSTAPALQAASDAKATMYLSANLVAVLSAFAVEAFVFQSLHRRWSSALIVLILLGFVYVTYRIAVTRARAWGESLLVAIDLHREDLRSALGLRTPTSAADADALWVEASQFFLPAWDRVDSDKLFGYPSDAFVSLYASAGIDAQVVASAADAVPHSVADGWVVLRRVQHVLLVSRAGDTARLANADVAVIDSRVGRIDRAPDEIRQGAVRGRASIADDDATLLWRIDGLATGDALALAYTLPLWTASVDHGTLELEFTRGVGISIQLSTLPARKRLLRIDNFTADQDALAVVSLGKSPIGPVEIGSRRTLWRLDAGARVWLDLPEAS